MGAAEEVCMQEVGQEMHLAQVEKGEVSPADQRPRSTALVLMLRGRLMILPS